MATKDVDMYGIFGPGDGKPVAIFADHDEARREGRKRFGERASVFPVSLGGMTSEQRDEVARQQATAEALSAESTPLRANALEAHRAAIRGSLQDEAYREALKAELGVDVDKATKAQQKAAEKAAAEAEEAAEKAAKLAAETRQESHAVLTKGQTGEAPPKGEEPLSAAHEHGIATMVSETTGAGQTQSTGPDLGVQSGANPAAAEDKAKATDEAKGKPKS